MINYYWYWNSNPTPKKTKQSYSGKRKHTIKTQVIIEQETKKLLQTSFSLLENMIMFLYLKNQKSQFLKNTKLIVDSGYQGIQKITIMF
ncbi:hypothetical protein [Spiroplasma poulsonii]|uniref:hypothetical protein n=1 Tax=Spiroplasma poulsonii TaxID=2138 RepID=UPI001F4CCB93|nr:hypothetical protein [Spiroplasma poulsonii]UNF61895.1 hypothetical protein MNU24_00035 [Spiroplasma poulsonii]